MTPMRTIVCAFLLLLGTLSLGCTQQLIPNTDVADTAENRKVIEFCEEYRRAVETRKVGFLLSLAHPKYYEDGGNIDAADDIDYEGLKEFLRDRFGGARGIRYEIRYRRVQESPRKTVLDRLHLQRELQDSWQRWRRGLAAPGRGQSSRTRPRKRYLLDPLRDVIGWARLARAVNVHPHTPTFSFAISVGGEHSFLH